MLASDAIAKLRTTELKQLSVTAVPDADVLGYLNEAVLELHKRYNLWQAEAIITHAAAKNSYDLDGVDVDVVIDLSDKILLIVTDAIDYLGDEMNINDEDDPFGIVTPKYNIVEFDLDELAVGEEFSILYRASPIDMTAVGDTVDIPPSLNEALYFYAGFRAHASQKGTKETENMNHFAKFLDACNRVEALGLVNAESVVPHKFADGTYPWP